MNMHTSYPVFESGQVLSSGHLNDLVDYLEEQDRLTRNKLIGIGVACGLVIDYDSPAKVIRLSKGCAVTSAGFLVFDEASTLNRFRPYTVPMPHLEQTPPEALAEARYKFFFGANDQQIALWELLPVGYVPAPGEPPLTALTDAFLANKVLLLFLESNLDSLKNCDINDCSDKGAERSFILRKLLVTKDDAQKILAAEKTIAGRPVDRSAHPRLGLNELSIEKINPAKNNVSNFQELHQRIATIIFGVVPKLQEALHKSYQAYAYLLGDVYPAAQFPGGPFSNGVTLDNVAEQYNSNPLMVQYAYDFFYDMVQAYNEFLRAAFRLDAECCPNPDRFPRHILLGELKPQPAAFLPQVPDWPKFDPLTAQTGIGPASVPAAFRHHFVPSPLLGGCHAGLREVQNLHYRIYLLAFRYSVEKLMDAELRITPSCSGDYALSDKSVPFYYAFNPGDDLHRCWSYARTTGGRLDQVYSHQFMDVPHHPLVDRMERHNFYRVEGLIGKPLGQAIEVLKKQKIDLGLSMGLAPVLIDVGLRDDATGIALNREARSRASTVMRDLIACRLGETDLFFLTTMGMLASYLFSIVALLARLNTTHVATAPPKPPSAPTRNPATPPRVMIDRRKSESTLREIRGASYEKGTLTSRGTTNTDPKQSVGQLYAQIKKTANNTNLFDRTREFTVQMGGQTDIEGATRRIYLPISLLEQTEDLIETIRAPSIAAFDFDAFDNKYEGFAKAFDAYLAEAPLEGDKVDATVLSINQALVANYGAVAGSAPQLVIANLAQDFRDRLDKLFDDLTFEPYARKNPGMEHRCGVPVGGTLVLLCAPRGFLGELLGSSTSVLDGIAKEFEKRFRGGANTRQPKTQIKTVLAKIPPAAAAPDELIVIGDFCLPYLCCDSDCSEVGFGSVKPPVQSPAIVKGTVFTRSIVGGQLGPAVVAKNATVEVTNLDKNTAVRVDVKDGSYAFTGVPGTYRIDAAVVKFVSQRRIITAAGGSTLTEDFVLVAG